MTFYFTGDPGMITDHLGVRYDRGYVPDSEVEEMPATDPREWPENRALYVNERPDTFYGVLKPGAVGRDSQYGL